MIEFEAKGTDVLANVHTGCSVEKPRYSFRWAEKYDATAQILARHLTERFTRLVRGLRVSLYNQGYEDGRNHRAKRTGFSGSLDER